MGGSVESALTSLDDITSNRSDAETWASNSVANADTGSVGGSVSEAG